MTGHEGNRRMSLPSSKGWCSHVVNDKYDVVQVAWSVEADLKHYPITCAFLELLHIMMGSVLLAFVLLAFESLSHL